MCLCEQHRTLALEAARESQVLLANDGLLPLAQGGDSTIALVGPHADVCHYGGYVGEITPQGVTPAQGLRSLLVNPDRLTVEPGCTFGQEGEIEDVDAMIRQAVAAAKNADRVILALGGTRQTCGEGRDNADIRLPGRQHELAHAVLECGKPTVLLLIGGRPWAVADLVERCNAVLLAWYGGVEAGTAIAQTLLGIHNPGGKLSMSFPKSVGHTQCSYLRRPFFTGAGWGGYRQHDNDPLFAFGHGLSYTTFSYGDVKLSAGAIGQAGTVVVTTAVTNTGKRTGDEVVQCYVSDESASVTQFVKRLRGFQRIRLEPGESREASFRLGPDELAIWDMHMRKMVEPGWFTVQVGGSSAEGKTARFEVIDARGRRSSESRAEAIGFTRADDMEAPD